MAYYEKPDQGIKIDIGDNGVYQSGGMLYIRNGNSLSVIPIEEVGKEYQRSQGLAPSSSTATQAATDYLKTLGYDINSIPQLSVNGGDLIDTFNRYNGNGLTLNNNAPSVFPTLADSLKTQYSTGASYTAGTAANNPNAVTLTSNQQGMISTPAPTPDPNAINPGNLSTYQNPNAGFNQTGSTAGFTQQPTIGINGVSYDANLMNADSALNFRTPAPIPQTTIENPIAPPVTNGAPPTPTLPTPQATNTVETFTAGLQTQLDNMRKQFEEEAKRRADEYEKQITELNAKNTVESAKQQDALNQVKGQTDAMTAEKKAALDLEKKRVEENYNANQALINEMDGLLTEGNKIIEQMRNTTGLASIMEPRIAKTMADVTARAGVIQALLSARNAQIGIAQSQLTSTINAVSSIYNDQIDYYSSLVDFYENQTDENESKLIDLKDEQKAYLDTKLKMLSDDMERLQGTADIIREAMLDPDTAMTYARAGVSLTDSPEAIAKKISDYQYTQELTNMANEMAANGYSSTPITNATPVTITDSRGKTKTFYKPASGGSEGVEIQSGNLTYTNQDYTEDSQALERSRGADGWVDPAVYLQLYNAWVQNGGVVNDFLSKFPPTKYVNPANKTLPPILQNTTASTGRTS